LRFLSPAAPMRFTVILGFPPSIMLQRYEGSRAGRCWIAEVYSTLRSEPAMPYPPRVAQTNTAGPGLVHMSDLI